MNSLTTQTDSLDFQRSWSTVFADLRLLKSSQGTSTPHRLAKSSFGSSFTGHWLLPRSSYSHADLTPSALAISGLNGSPLLSSQSDASKSSSTFASSFTMRIFESREGLSFALPSCSSASTFQFRLFSFQKATLSEVTRQSKLFFG